MLNEEIHRGAQRKGRGEPVQNKLTDTSRQVWRERADTGSPQSDITIPNTATNKHPVYAPTQAQSCVVTETCKCVCVGKQMKAVSSVWGHKGQLCTKHVWT